MYIITFLEKHLKYFAKNAINSNFCPLLLTYFTVYSTNVNKRRKKIITIREKIEEACKLR